MTGLSFCRTSVSKFASVTTLVAPTGDHILLLVWVIPVTQAVSAFLARQPALRIEGGRATRPGRGHGLPVRVVDHVAAGEHALDGRARRRLVDQQVALGVRGQLP